jgi:excisionase family DNA binding protein
MRRNDSSSVSPIGSREWGGVWWGVVPVDAAPDMGVPAPACPSARNFQTKTVWLCAGVETRDRVRHERPRLTMTRISVPLYRWYHGARHKVCQCKSKEMNNMDRNSPSKTAAAERVRPFADDLIDLDECARIAGLRTRTVSHYIGMGRIPSVRVGTARLFSRCAIMAWVERRERRREQMRELGGIDYVETPGVSR